MPDHAISFSSRPQLLKLGDKPVDDIPLYYCHFHPTDEQVKSSKYIRDILSLYTGDCTNTDFGAVMDLLKKLDKNSAPQYLIVLSDMEFDRGSKHSKDTTMNIFKERGINTKIVWWNFNSGNTTCPEVDSYGNIYMSGYNPILLKYLECGFNGQDFLDKLLKEYAAKVFPKVDNV